MISTSKMNSIVVVITFLLFELAACKIPEYIKICHKNEQLSECLLQNSQAVIQYLAANNETKYKIPQIDKIRVDKLALYATKDLKVLYINLDIIGLDKAAVREISLGNEELHMKIYLPSLQFTGKHNLDGSIIGLNIKSDGDMNVTLVKVLLDYTAKLKTEEHKSKNYYYVSNDQQETRTKMESIEDNYFYFGNLFPGNARISEEMNLFINDNWKDIYREAGDSLVQQITELLLNPVINGYLRHIPTDNLFAT